MTMDDHLVEMATLDFDLSDAIDRPYTLYVGAAEYALERHSEETLAEAVRTNRAIASIPPRVRSERVTHVVRDVPLRADAPTSLHVTPHPPGERPERRHWR